VVDQEFLENLTNKFAVPLAILGAGMMTVLLVSAALGMLMNAPGAAGTSEGPAIYQHSR